MGFRVPGLGVGVDPQKKKVKEEGKDAPWVRGVHENKALRAGQLE